jgi:hypothetical protein
MKGRNRGESKFPRAQYEVETRSLPAQRIILSAAQIADSIERGDAPLPEALFLLAAAMVDAARCGDIRALWTGVDSAVALLDGLPGGESWRICRAQLRIILQFAWLLKELGGHDDRS